MKKDFDEWNNLKKKIDEKQDSVNFYFHEREIWWCSIGINVGIETNGKNEDFERPVLILKVFNRNMIWYLPTTSSIRQSKFYYVFRINDMYKSINITQIKTIDSKRLIRKIGIVEEGDFNKIRHIIKDLI